MPTSEQIDIEQLLDSGVSATLSRAIPLADIPEPKNFNVEFNFQGFEISREVQVRLSEFQSVKISFDSIPDAKQLNEYSIGELIGDLGTTIQSSISEDSLILYNSQQLIQSELLSSDNVSSIYLYDNFASDTASELIENIANGLNIDIANLSLSDGASSILNSVNTLTTAGSSTGGIDVIEGVTNNQNLVEDIVTAMFQENAFRNETDIATDDFSITIIGKLSEVDHALFFDNRIINDIAKISAKNNFSPFSTPFAGDVNTGEYESTQDAARTEFSDGDLTAEDYEFIVNPVNFSVADGGEISETKIAGYILEKFEIIEGVPELQEPYFISANDIATGESVTINDPEVTLGNLYTYALSTIAIIKVRDVNNLTSGDVEDIEIIVKSRPKTSSLVAGGQFPDPPTDLNYYYDNERNDLMLVWDFPSTDQTSLIKKFQIFRRESVLEPFTLVRQYDFDDSEIPVDQIDDVDFGLNVKLKEPLTFYIDEDFKKDKEYIYAICSISSDGASSPYSTQTSVRFSTAKNDLVMRKISQSGAPKPYPNFYLEQDLDTDLIRVSKSNAMTVFYDPDVFDLSVPGDVNNDGIVDPEEIQATQFLTTNRLGGKYVMQLINLDLLKEQRFEITVDDPDNLVLDLSGA
jgi:hypothetical protein